MTTLLILGEDVAHGALAGELVRRTLVAHAEVVDAQWFVDHPEAALSWQGEEDLGEVRPGLRYTKSSAAGKKLKLRGRWPEGHVVPEESGAPGFQYWRGVLTWALLQADVAGIVVVTDTDGMDQTSLARVAEKLPAIDRPDAPRPIVLGIAHQDAEGWLVLGFVPRDANERRRHAALVRALAFDPLKAPHRLTARPNEARTDAKRVLRQLLWAEDRSKAIGREEIVAVVERCLPSAEVIDADGAGCGLKDFVAAVRRRLSPLFGLPPG